MSWRGSSNPIGMSRYDGFARGAIRDEAQSITKGLAGLAVIALPLVRTCVQSGIRSIDQRLKIQRDKGFTLLTPKCQPLTT